MCSSDLAQRVLVDPVTASVVIDDELGAAGSGRPLPIEAWWFYHRTPDVEVTMGEHVARVLGHLSMASAGDAQVTLDAVVGLVQRLAPAYVGYGRRPLEKALTAHVGR